MSYLTRLTHLSLAALLSLFSATHFAAAVSLTPNPNPLGNTITVPNGQTRTVGSTYNNYAVIDIDLGGTVQHATASTYSLQFHNRDGADVNNSGTLINWGYFNNYAGADYTIGLSAVHEEHYEFWSEGAIANYGAINMLDRFGDGSHFVTIGHFINYGTGDINVDLDSVFGIDGTFTNYGRIDMSPDTLMGTSGAFTNYGSIDAHGDFENYYVATLDNHSLIDSTGNFTNYGTFQNHPGATLNILNYAWSDNTINNAGRVFIDSTAQLDTTFNAYFGPSYYNQTAGETQINGTLYQNHVDVGGGIVFGTGTLRARGDGDGLTVHDSGWVQPGLSPGTLTVSGNVFYNGGGLEIEILSDSVFDFLQIFGSLSASGGELRFVFLEGYVPHIGGTFDFLAATDGITGLENFTITTTGLPGAVIEVNLDSGGLVMTLLDIPEPTSFPFLTLTLFSLLPRRRSS